MVAAVLLFLLLLVVVVVVVGLESGGRIASAAAEAPGRAGSAGAAAAKEWMSCGVEGGGRGEGEWRVSGCCRVLGWRGRARTISTSTQQGIDAGTHEDKQGRR